MAETEAATAQAEEEQAPDTQLVATLTDGTNVRRRKPRQRACNLPGKNNNICRGHLKRWYPFGSFGEEIERQFGPNPELYRCERCQTLYLPSPDETPRTGTLSY